MLKTDALKGIFYSILIMSLFGCSRSIDNLAVHYNQTIPLQSSNGQVLLGGQPRVNIQYLGVGGYLFQYGDDSIMTAPSFTNPSLISVTLPLSISTDTELVDKLLPEHAKQAEYILVGHAHYDHLMDVPYIMQQHMPEATAVGSTTMANIVGAVIKTDRLLDITANAAVGQQSGQWIYNRNKTIRFMPIKSEHAPHFMGIKVMSGQYDEVLTELPTTAYGWKEGQTYAYVIDFLDNQQQPIYRIHYQDAASNSPDGLMPIMADNKVVDMTILCVAAFHQVDDYPEAILQQTQPNMIVMGHWEDFFDNNSFDNNSFDNANKPLKGVRMTNIDDFVQRVNLAKPNATTFLPAPFSWIQAY